MYHPEFRHQKCILRRDLTCGDEIHFSSGDKFIMTGYVKLAVHGSFGRVITELGILPSEQLNDPRAEIFVDADDIVICR